MLYICGTKEQVCSCCCKRRYFTKFSPPSHLVSAQISAARERLAVVREKEKAEKVPLSVRCACQHPAKVGPPRVKVSPETHFISALAGDPSHPAVARKQVHFRDRFPANS